MNWKEIHVRINIVVYAQILKYDNMKCMHLCILLIYTYMNIYTHVLMYIHVNTTFFSGKRTKKLFKTLGNTLSEALLRSRFWNCTFFFGGCHWDRCCAPSIICCKERCCVYLINLKPKTSFPLPGGPAGSLPRNHDPSLLFFEKECSGAGDDGIYDEFEWADWLLSTSDTLF